MDYELDQATIAEIQSIQRNCRATNRAGNPCGNRAIPGGAVCRMHGGAAPQVRAKAAERLTLVRDLALERLYTRFADGDPLDPKILLDAVVRLGQQVELLEGRATSRAERVDTDAIRVRLTGMIRSLEERRTQREGQA